MIKHIAKFKMIHLLFYHCSSCCFFPHYQFYVIFFQFTCSVPLPFSKFCMGKTHSVFSWPRYNGMILTHFLFRNRFSFYPVGVLTFLKLFFLGFELPTSLSSRRFSSFVALVSVSDSDGSDKVVGPFFSIFDLLFFLCSSLFDNNKVGEQSPFLCFFVLVG